MKLTQVTTQNLYYNFVNKLFEIVSVAQGVGTGSNALKISVAILFFMMVMLAGYWLDTRQQLQELKRIQSKEDTLKNELILKKQKISALKKYSVQLELTKKSLNQLLQELPTHQDLNTKLLAEIIRMGNASGIKIKLFKPMTESKASLYTTTPIQIVGTGTYQQFSEFFQKITNGYVIVTWHDFNLYRSREYGTGVEDETLVLDAMMELYTQNSSERGKLYSNSR